MAILSDNGLGLLSVACTHLLVEDRLSKNLWVGFLIALLTLALCRGGLRGVYRIFVGAEIGGAVVGVETEVELACGVGVFDGAVVIAVGLDRAAEDLCRVC